MNKIKKIITFSIFLLLAVSIHAQTCIKKYSFIASEIRDCSIDHEGNYIISGAFLNNCMLFKLNSQGDSLWAKYYYPNTIGIVESGKLFKSIKITDTNEYIAAGSFGVNNAFIVKTNANGDTIWTKLIPCNGYIAGENILLLPDGNILLTGQTSCDTEASDIIDAFLAKIDGQTGQIIWQRNYLTSLFNGTYYATQATKVVQVQDGYLILANYGWDGPFTIGLSGSMYLIKTDFNGFMQWDRKNFGCFAYVSNLEVLPDGNLLVCGSGCGSGHFFAKLHNNGDTIWTRSYDALIGTSPLIRDILVADNRYLLAGGIHKGLLIETDTSGNIVWRREEYPNVDLLEKTFKDTVGLISIGYNRTLGIYDYIYFIKTDSTGYYQGLGTHSTSTVPISVYPNPAANTLSINHQNLPTAQTVQVYNLTGQLVLQQNLQQNNTTISVAGLQVGVYMLQIKAGNTLAQQKVVVWR